MNRVESWVIETLNASPDLPPSVREECLTIGIRMARRGYLRGDISDAWRNRFPELSSADIPDLYV